MKVIRYAVALGLLSISAAAGAETGVAVRPGTLGIGVDIDFSLTEQLNLRLGYAGFNHDRTVEDTDVRYDGELKLSNFSALLDWHPGGSGFRFSLGAVASGTTLDVVGRPTAGEYVINDQRFTAAQVGSLRGEVEFGNSVAPYVGLGWGNAVRGNHRVTFLFDIGGIYGGTPTADLTAQCGASVPAPACAQLQAAVAAEEAELQDEVSLLKWYPVVSIGLAIRF